MDQKMAVHSGEDSQSPWQDLIFWNWNNGMLESWNDGFKETSIQNAYDL